jgi:FtsP/CotA-like multicopper oxidase with cupredoxin domain
MMRKPTPHGVSRRRFLQLSGQGALLTVLAGSGLRQALAEPLTPQCLQYPQPSCHEIRLLATDGFMSLPGRRRGADNGVYAFGFRGVLPGETFAGAEVLIPKYKFQVQWPSPILGVDKNSTLYITMTNLGFEIRPDLDDAHSVHWHGFRNPNSIFDGVPEVSIAVPPARDFPYFYRPRNEGTYMYHCHFEDTEHVQLGMDGIVYIKAATPAAAPFLGRAYDNDSNTTRFHRQFTLLLNEVDPAPHDGLRDIQEFIWSNYKASYWLINGRAYPDTIVRDQELASYASGDFNLPFAGLPPDPDLGFSQPVSSLIQVTAGETALLRFVNLGYEQHAMQLLGPRMRVVGHDAVFLGSQVYETNTVYIGPGEARDVLVTAPSFSLAQAVLEGTIADPAGRPYNRYWLRNRNSQRLVNGNQPGLGGMVTQMWVYPAAASLPAQPGPNVTV